MSNPVYNSSLTSVPFSPADSNKNFSQPPIYPTVTTVKTVKVKKKNRFFLKLFFFLIIFLLIAGAGAYAGITLKNVFTDNKICLLKVNDKCYLGYASTSSNDNSGVNSSQALNTSQNDQSFSSNADVSDLYAKVSPAVVSIVLDQKVGNKTEVAAVASGFIVDSSQGLIVTNDHVVCTTGTYRVITKDNRSLRVLSVTRDSADDLALVKVDVSKDKLSDQLRFVKDSDRVRPGQFVIAIGNPLGESPATVTTGIVSNINRSVSASGTCNEATITKDYEAVFQTDASINPGNSGGPLLNSDGDVIGVNSATSPNASNISFSIPANRVVRKINEYLKTGKFQNPYLGVKYSMILPADSAVQNLPTGALVAAVLSNSPADKAGLQKDDIITKFDGKDVDFSLQTQISAKAVGDIVDVVVQRPDASGNLKEVKLKVTLGSLPTSTN